MTTTKTKPKPNGKAKAKKADDGAADLQADVVKFHAAVDARIAAGGPLNPDAAAEHVAFQAELAKQSDAENWETTAEQLEPDHDPTAMTAAEAEHYAAIKSKETEVAELERIFLDLKERAADAKKDFEASDKSLRRMIAAGPKEPKTVREASRVRITQTLIAPPVKAGEEYDVQEVDEDGEVRISIEGEEPADCWLAAEEVEVIAWREVLAKQDESTEAAAPPANNDAWRKTPLKGIFKGKLLSKLTDAGMVTIGDLAEYQSGFKRLTDIKDIGPELEAQIGDTMADWFAKHPEACETPKEPDAKPRGELGKAMEAAGIGAKVGGNGKH